MNPSHITLFIAGIAVASIAGACSSNSSQPSTSTAPSPQDERLKGLIDAQKLALPDVEAPLAKDSPLVTLGRALFFDKAISGENDTSCSTCHLPSQALSNALPLPIGPGGQGTGPGRKWGDSGRTLQWRNSPSIVNRALPGWNALTFASQVHLDATSKPTGVPVVYDPSTVTAGSMGLLEIQAHFPPTGRDNLLGLPDAQNTLNQPGSALAITSFDPHDAKYATPVDFLKDVWRKLTLKILQFDEYKQMFAAAYPGVAPSDYTFLHIGRALASFESSYFVFRNSPWDRYSRGEIGAMTQVQKDGAELFLTRGCSNCHSGAFLTDQQHHNIGVPPFGTGPQPAQLITGNADLNTIAADIGFPIPPAQNAGPHIDFGVADLEKGVAVSRDLFAVRTIPLHDVELTGPYFHNGTYQDLKSAVVHHLDADAALDHFDSSYLQGWLDTVNGPSTDHQELRAMKSPAVIAKVHENIDPRVQKGAMQLSDAEVDKVVEFLKALTDPALKDIAQTIGDVQTPSKLPIDR